MKFPIKHCIFIAVCLLLTGFILSGCDTQVTERPAFLQVAANDDSSVHLSWASVADATGYRVYRRVSGDTDFKFVTDTKTAYYTDVQPKPGKYDYQVTALGPYGESAGTVFLAAAEERKQGYSRRVICSIEYIHTKSSALCRTLFFVFVAITIDIIFGSLYL